MTFIDGNAYFKGRRHLYEYACGSCCQCLGADPNRIVTTLKGDRHHFTSPTAGKVARDDSGGSRTILQSCFLGQVCLDGKLYEKYGAFVDVMQEIDRLCLLTARSVTTKGIRIWSLTGKLTGSSSSEKMAKGLLAREAIFPEKHCLPGLMTDLKTQWLF